LPVAEKLKQPGLLGKFALLSVFPVLAPDRGRNLGLEVVAEGVESAEAWRDRELYGCDVAQGYYLSRAVPADELTAWLRVTGGLVHEPRFR